MSADAAERLESPGSLKDFSYTPEDGHTPTDAETFEAFTIAVGSFQNSLARQRGISPGELHDSPNPGTPLEAAA